VAVGYWQLVAGRAAPQYRLGNLGGGTGQFGGALQSLVIKVVPTLDLGARVNRELEAGTPKTNPTAYQGQNI